MNKNVKTPGPAQDGLNKMFAKHLPDVAPPRNQQSLYQPELPLYSDELTPVASGTSTPNLAPNLNIQNLGGTIESWARRMASQAKTVMEPNERHLAARASVGTPGKGAGGIGDLIEMTDEFEIGDDEGDAEPQRGRQGSVVHVGNSSTSGTSYFDHAARQRESSKPEGSKGRKAGKDD